MVSVNDFTKKQVLIFCPARGDKLSYQNDNVMIKDANGVTKYQHTCYSIFAIYVIGDTTITTGLLRRIKKYNICICFMSMSFRLYSVVGYETQGNTLLHQKQYAFVGSELAQHIIRNKVTNQRANIANIRRKTEDVKEAIRLLDSYIRKLDCMELERDVLLGVEGNSAKVYFARIFSQVEWKGRKPRIKFDYVNSLLDIGYTVLFNFIDSVLQVFGFDVYQGVLHTCFYMRKSLVCDVMEPFRPIIDWRVRTGINLGQLKKEDFVLVREQWQLEYKKSATYTAFFMEVVLEHKEEIFLYVREYYRSFMKGKSAKEFPVYVMCNDCVE